MFKNYLTTAFRNLARNRTSSLINVFGLTMGVTFSLFIFLWVRDEWQTDKFHDNANQLFRVLQTQRYQDGKRETSDRTPFLLADALKAEIPEISHATMLETDRFTIQTEKKIVSEAGIFASADFWKMFTFRLVKGQAESVLLSASNIVISERLSRKLFGSGDPIGKLLKVDSRREYFVSGVFADVPMSSSLKFECIFSSKDYERYPWANDWGAIGNKTYVRLHPEADAEAVAQKIKHFLKDKQPENKDQLSLQQLTEQYLYSNFKDGVQDGGRIEYVQLLSVVAILILVVACINFMNLSTAQASKRAREVGVRKVVGAQQRQLFIQFTTEALIIVSLSVLLSLVVVEALLPYFNNIAGKQIALRYTSQMTLVLLSITIVTGFIAGSYPALFLSSLKSNQVLKGVLHFKPGVTLARKGLVTLQFVLSFLFISATLIIHEQLEYVQTKNLGFDKTDLVTVGMNGSGKIYAFKNELLQNPLIRSVTYANQTALQIDRTTTWIDWAGNIPRREINFAFAGVGYDYLQTMGIELKEGRDFSAAVTSDSLNVIVNEKAVKQMGLTNPIGHDVTTTRDLVRHGKIIGVVKDFHLQSMHAPILPLYLFLDTWPNGAAVEIRIQHSVTAKSLAHIKKIFKKYNPDEIFTYQLATDSFNRQYANEMLLKNLANYFAFLAIAISGLGLFGLVVFSAEQRTKEIGIRKVLGASIRNILVLLSNDFLKLVGMAVVVTIPLALYLSDTWLDNFAYRTELKIGTFVLTGVFLFFVAILTIGIKALGAARANPIDALRTE
jgi:putative ABC transport system permease protein